MSAEEKKAYMKSELTDKGYDEFKFISYISNLEEGEKIDMSTCTLNELENAIAKYKEAEGKAQQEPKEEKGDDSDKEEIPAGKNSGKEIILEGEAFENYEEKIATKKLEPSPLASIENLYIDVTNPEKVNPGALHKSYYQYTITLKGTEYACLRRLNDFEFFYEKLEYFHRGKFIPLLAKSPVGLADDSEKKLLYLKYFLNALVDDPYFKAHPVVFEFLTMPLPEWVNKRKEYEKMKNKKPIPEIESPEGSFNIAINTDTNIKVKKIDTEIKEKEKSFLKVRDSLEELFSEMDRVSKILKNVSISFLELKYKYTNTSDISEYFKRIYYIFKKWSEDCVRQKDFLHNEVKYYFAYMDKENTSFLKNIDRFKTNQERYKYIFDKVKSNKGKVSDKDKAEFEKFRTSYGFYSVCIIEEYDNLCKRQAERTKKQFNKFKDRKDLIFQDYENIIKLFNLEEKPMMSEEVPVLESLIH